MPTFSKHRQKIVNWMSDILKTKTEDSKLDV